MNWRPVIYAALVALTAQPVAARQDECPDFNVTQSQADGFCDAFLELLYGPVAPDSQRGGTDQVEPNIARIIGSDPLWGEVYRADPNSTLSLIQRIRDAGGLRN